MVEIDEPVVPVDLGVDIEGLTKTEIKKRKKVAKMLAAGAEIPESLVAFLPPGTTLPVPSQPVAEPDVEPTVVEEAPRQPEVAPEAEPLAEAEAPIAEAVPAAKPKRARKTATPAAEPEPKAVPEAPAEVAPATAEVSETAEPVAKPKRSRKAAAENTGTTEAPVPVENEAPAESAPVPVEAPTPPAPIAEAPPVAADAPVEAPVAKPKKSRKAESVPAATVEAPAAPADSGFAELGLPASLLAAVVTAGFESPTPIQARAIPPLLAGHDVVGQAQTGTGKTAAFALPLLARLDPNETGTQALVVVPTRELAIQAAEQIHRFGPDIRVVPVYGGQPIDRQFRSLLRPPAVVVGTPGRLLDHLRRGSLNLGTVRFCALDEADEMLSFGFIDDIETILAELPEMRQTALFSATMPPRIAALSDKYLRNAVRIEVEAKRRTVETVRQYVYEVAPGRKREALARILDMEAPGPTIVFCRTRAETQELADTLRMRGYDAEPLHGEMAQAERDRIMRKFRDEQTDLLVATDVAARGLDIEGVTHVVNFDLPWDVEQYIHRIGRTGRAGREGDAITIIEPKERRNLRRFEYLLGLRLEPRRLPSSADIATRRRAIFSGKVRAQLEAGGFDDQLQAVGELTESWDVADIAAAALHLLWEASGGGKATAVDDELALEGERPEPGMARLFVGLGRFDRIRPTDLIGVVRNETGLPPGAIGTIDIMDRCSFLEVPQEHAEAVIRVLGSVPYRGRRPKAGYARPKDGEPGPNA